MCKAVKVFPNSGWFQFKDFFVHQNIGIIVLSCVNLLSMRFSGFQCFRVSKFQVVQVFKVSRVQRFRSSIVQDFKSSEVQRFVIWDICLNQLSILHFNLFTFDFDFFRFINAKSSKKAYQEIRYLAICDVYYESLTFTRYALLSWFRKMFHQNIH